MNPLDFLQIAERFKDSVSQCEVRTSIGRAYYAVYNHVIDTLRGLGLEFREDGKLHMELVRALKATNDDSIKSVGELLEELRSRRNHADYRMDRLFVSRDAQFSVIQAHEIKQIVEALSEAQQRELRDAGKRLKTR